MNKAIEAINKASEMSLGQMAVVSTSDHTMFFGADCGETVDIKIEKGMVKLVMLQLPSNADAKLAFEKVDPLKDLLAKAKASGVEVGTLVYSQRFTKGATNEIALNGISSIELATGATRLVLPGYVYVDLGNPRTYPEAAAIKALQTKRGEDLLKVLLKNIGERWTTQSLQKATEADSKKAISTSVVHRFTRKLKDLGLVADAGATGFCLTTDGAKKIEDALPELFKIPIPFHSNTNKVAKAASRTSDEITDDEFIALTENKANDDDIIA